MKNLDIIIQGKWEIKRNNFKVNKLVLENFPLSFSVLHSTEIPNG